jgi:Domain of unknown function (DUF4352)
MKSLFGMMGLLSLIAAVIVGSLAAVGVLSNAATSSRVGAPGNYAAQQAAAPAGPAKRLLDESVSAGNLRWSVHEVSRRSELDAYTYPPTILHGDFLVVSFTVKNTSEVPVTLTEDSIALVARNGFESRPAASVNSEYVDPEKAILFNEGGLLEPGEETEGRVNFDLTVPFGAGPSSELSGFRLQLGDGDPRAEEGERLDLGL